MAFWGERGTTELRAATDKATALLSSPDFTWVSDDGKTLLTRLVLATPFSCFDVRTPLAVVDSRRTSIQRDGSSTAPDTSLPLIHAFGAVLNAVTLPRARLRPYANAWVRWSRRVIHELAGTHACARGNRRPDMPCPCSDLHGRAVPDMLDIPETSLDGPEDDVGPIQASPPAVLP